MIRSHLLDAFLSTAWHLHTEIYNRLSDLLEAHILGHKDDLRTRLVMPLPFAMADETDTTPPDETAGDYLDNGVAVISVRGVLAMHADQINGACQPTGRSYDSIIDQVEIAAADPNVRAIVLRLETPGGSACGCQEAYDAIKTASIAKPVHAFLDGYCFSAGTYLASACDSIVAGNAMTQTGSIGTVMAVWDTSAAAEAEGLKRVVVRSGPYKALGQDGEKITDAAIAEMQRMVDGYSAAFYDAVRSGRGLTDEQAAAVLNGRTFMASEAIGLGLVDAIQTFKQFIAGIAGQEQIMFGRKTKSHQADTSAAADNKEPDMALDPKALAAFAKANPQHAQLILEEAAKDNASKETIQAAIAVADAKLKDDEINSLKDQLAKQSGIHAAALKVETDKVADLTAKLASVQKVADLGKNTPADVGGDATATDREKDPLAEANLKAAWDGSEKLREGFGGDFDALKALAKNDKKTAIAALGIKTA